MKTCFCLFISITVLVANAQPLRHDAPGAGNPLLPGYFADPTIKKFGDAYYIYATTDGVKLASGQPTVWVSYDLANWYNQELDIELPQGLTNCWAPDVVQGRDGKYYYYMGNCQFGCNIYGYVSNTPVGPWKPINNGQAVIPVGTGKEGLPALDAQFLVDDDGSIYSYFGTWCTSFKGMGWAKINATDMHTIEQSGYVPIEQIPHAFEAAYPIKQNGKYVLMYSSGDCRLSSYAVHYAYADHPTGPFTYGANNPIIQTDDYKGVDSPGHHSIITIGNESYIVYHRHDNPHSTGGEFRQVCMDKLLFLNDSTLAKVDASNTGVCFTSASQPKNLALNANATATSSYRLASKATRYSKTDVDHLYKPEFATDDNNGTLWKANGNALPQALTIDLGQIQPIKRIVTQFEYPTFYYQYKIDVSENGHTWQPFANRTTNRTAGSPMVDDNTLLARYVRLTVTGTEKTGMYAAVWNLKVFGQTFDMPQVANHAVNDAAGTPSTNSLLVNFDAAKLPTGVLVAPPSNKGSLKGQFLANGQPQVTMANGVQSLYLDGQSYLELSVPAPLSLDWNAPFTASAWVCVPHMGDAKCVMAWNSRDDMLQASYAAFMLGQGPYGAMAHGDGSVDLPFANPPSQGQWHCITVTFDGMLEQVYVDGKLDNQCPLMLFVDADRIRIGASGEEAENFVGYIAKAQLFDKALAPTDVAKLVKSSRPKGIKQ